MVESTRAVLFLLLSVYGGFVLCRGQALRGGGAVRRAYDGIVSRTGAGGGGNGDGNGRIPAAAGGKTKKITSEVRFGNTFVREEVDEYLQQQQRRQQQRRQIGVNGDLEDEDEDEDDERQLGQFDWDVNIVEGYPLLNVGFDGEAADQVLFLYNFTGDVTGTGRSVDVTLMEFDCIAPGALGEGNGLMVTQQDMVEDELSVAVDVSTETITESQYYSSVNLTTAEIAFCVRVDYKYDGDSVNFFENKIVISVDLTEGFQLTSIDIDRTKKSQAEADVRIDCEIHEYFCDDYYNEVPPPTLSQGDSMTACVISTGAYNIRDIIEAKVAQDQDKDGQIDNHDIVVTSRNPDFFTTKECVLGRCKIKTQLKAKYFENPFPANLTLSGMVVCGFGSTPSIHVQDEIKPVVSEDGTLTTYPVSTSLHDDDGSDTWYSMEVGCTTIGNGMPPLVGFGTIPEGVNEEIVENGIRLTGDTDGINEAMRTLEVAPGESNGEDITCLISGTAQALSRPEVKKTKSNSFTIPVNPVVQGSFTLEHPSEIVSQEDTTFQLTPLEIIFVGNEDVDGSEQTVFEIETSSYEAGTQFWANNVRVYTENDGWLVISKSALGNVKMRAPGHYSGNMTLNLRAAIIDTVSNDNVVAATPPKPMTVVIQPKADTIITPSSKVVGIEDQGPIYFGATIYKKTSSGIRIRDTGSGWGNNEETETISQIQVVVPADSATTTYTMSGVDTEVGSAKVTFDESSRTYTISSSIITDAEDVAQISQAQREQAEEDIRDVLAPFTVEMGPAHNDDNGGISVKVTTLDVMGGYSSTRVTSFNPIEVRAVADMPGIEVSALGESVLEDGASIPLNITAFKSADVDGSETLWVRITVPDDGNGLIGTITGATPSGVTLTDQGSGVYKITADGPTPIEQETQLNSYLSLGGVEFNPRAHFSGQFYENQGLKVDVVSEETGSLIAPSEYGGDDGDAKYGTATAHIGVEVMPVADQAIVSINGNAIGSEDGMIDVPISVSLQDQDGSESIVAFTINDDLPEGTILYGDDVQELTPSNGVYSLTMADVSALTLKPPLHYSSALEGQGDITLYTETTVSDSGQSESIEPFSINVRIIGVADKPVSRTIVVEADEDTPYPLGAAVGDTSTILVDNDGSETLYLVVSNLPTTDFPQITAGEMNYLGGGKWQLSEEAVPGLTLPSVESYSGEDVYSGITLKAVSQEMDGDEDISDAWDVSFDIAPVADGFASWGLGVSATEGENEAGTLLSLSSAGSYQLEDDDGSEVVDSFVFDLSNLIADAKIATRLLNLEGEGAGLDELVDKYLVGEYSYDSGGKKVTVQPADISGIALKPDLFLDSNENFGIPVEAVVVDSASINGQTVTDTKIEQGTLSVSLTGTADVPSVITESVVGPHNHPIPINLGGATTDTDAALDRPVSEDVYYIAEMTGDNSIFDFVFTDGSGAVRGLDGGNNYWKLEADELTDLHIMLQADYGTNVTIYGAETEFKWTVIAVENDGDVAMNSETFNVTLVEAFGGVSLRPLPPIVHVGVSRGNEDTAIPLNITAEPDPEDTVTSNPIISFIVPTTSLPDGANFTGGRYNPYTHEYVLSEAEVESGAAVINTPQDFAGTFVMTMQATASDGLWRSDVLEFEATVQVDHVADGCTVSASPASGLEDEVITLAVTIDDIDVDGSEEIGDYVYIAADSEASLYLEGGGDVNVVGTEDDDASIGGQSLVGLGRVPLASLPNVRIQPAEHWHGEISVTIAGYATEPDDDDDGDNVEATKIVHKIKIEAVADPPAVTVPSEITVGDEDSSITIPGLSAELVDNEGENGVEVLSVVISNVPSGSQFNHGANNGDGSWYIPPSKLDSLSFIPPENFAGNVTLTVTAIALETSNADEASTVKSFDVSVTPVPDGFLKVAEDVAMDSCAGTADVVLNVRMVDDRGTLPGEVAPETVTLSFDDVPEGVSMESTTNPNLPFTDEVDGETGTRTITFPDLTEDLANSLRMVGVPASSLAPGAEVVIDVHGYTTDGGVAFNGLIYDDFVFTHTDPELCEEELPSV